MKEGFWRVKMTGNDIEEGFWRVKMTGNDISHEHTDEEFRYKDRQPLI